MVRDSNPSGQGQPEIEQLDGRGSRDAATVPPGVGAVHLLDIAPLPGVRGKAERQIYPIEGGSGVHKYNGQKYEARYVP
jgi:hypothetical protein